MNSSIGVLSTEQKFNIIRSHSSNNTAPSILRATCRALAKSATKYIAPSLDVVQSLQITSNDDDPIDLFLKLLAWGTGLSTILNNRPLPEDTDFPPRLRNRAVAYLIHPECIRLTVSMVIGCVRSLRMECRKTDDWDMFYSPLLWLVSGLLHWSLSAVCLHVFVSLRAWAVRRLRELVVEERA